MSLLTDSPIHSSEHAPSYYAASQRDKENFPSLQQDLRVDVCIVGGGLSGVATAVELSEAGFKVALLEGQRIGWGASGRNGGQIIGGFGEALSGSHDKLEKTFGAGANQALWNMGLECVDIIRQRVDKYNIDCDLKWGYLDVARKPREERDLKSWQQELMENNFPHDLQWLDRQAVREVVGSEKYISGLVNQGQGHLQVLDLCKGEARAAESLGAKIFEQSLVTELVYGDVCQVKTAQATVSADYVVLAGNAYLGQLSPDVAPELTPYVLPASSYVIATEPLSDEVANSVLSKDYAVCDQRTALDYFRLSADKRLLFGGMSNYSARDPQSITATMSASMHKVFPQLDGVKVDYEWGGHMGIGLNRVPQFGRLKPNVYYVQAYSGHGVAPTHMSARILSELIQNQSERFDIMARVKHMRFPGGRMFGNQLMALGMMFYKIRDEIM